MRKADTEARKRLPLMTEPVASPFLTLVGRSESATQDWGQANEVKWDDLAIKKTAVTRRYGGQVSYQVNVKLWEK